MGVIPGNIRRLDQPGQQVDPFYVRLASQCARQLDDISGLPAGIGIAPQFEVVPAYQPMHTDHEDIQ